MSMTVSRLSFPTQQRPGLRPRLVRFWKSLGSGLGAAWRDAAARRQLATLDDRSLSDIGISRAQARFVAEQPAWELMPHQYR